MLYRMHGISFDWLTWRNGWLDDLGIKHNYFDIINNQNRIKKYAIGWCLGTEVLCRQKEDTYAVMFLKGERQFWTHLTKKEFEEIFSD